MRTSTGKPSNGKSDSHGVKALRTIVIENIKAADPNFDQRYGSNIVSAERLLLELNRRLPNGGECRGGRQKERRLDEH